MDKETFTVVIHHTGPDNEVVVFWPSGSGEHNDAAILRSRTLVNLLKQTLYGIRGGAR